MSILITGMAMPEHCGYCRFRYDGICHALQKTQYSMEECPLVLVPPHGRLIDMDELCKKLLSAPEARFTPKELAWALDCEEATPTIIPAEEGERRLQKPKK